MSPSIWLNRLVLYCPMGLFPLNCNCNTYFRIIVLSILFTLLNDCHLILTSVVLKKGNSHCLGSTAVPLRACF
jgi:hypothetical protein